EVHERGHAGTRPTRFPVCIAGSQAATKTRRHEGIDSSCHRCCVSGCYDSSAQFERLWGTMHTLKSFSIGIFVVCQVVQAQTPSEARQPVATMKQLRLDVIYPASNSLLLIVNRRGPSDEKEWAEVRRSAMTLAESTNLLIMRNRSAAWITDAR